MKVWEKFRNSKSNLVRTAILVFLTCLIFAAIAYAVTTFWSFNQNLTVPAGSLVLYSNSTATAQYLIGDGSNQSSSSIWRWNGLEGWNATVFVQNNGTSIINFTVSVSAPTGWHTGYVVPAGQSRMAIGEIRAIDLWIYTSPAPVAGTQTGSFTVTVTAT
jgi:hypothetical protein